MKAKVLPITCWMYPDVTEYHGQKDKIELHTTPFYIGCCQIFLEDVENKVEWSSDIEGISVKPMIPVYVSDNPNLDVNKIEDFPIKKAPFYAYDCIGEFNDDRYMGKNVGLYVEYNPRLSGKIGRIEGFIKINSLVLHTEINVYDIDELGENLLLFNNYQPKKAGEYHNFAEETPEYEEIDNKCLKLIRKMHEDALYVQKGFTYTKEVNGFKFDFSKQMKFCKKAKEFGFRYFYLPSIGGRLKWDSSDILVGEYNLNSEDGKNYVRDYCIALRNEMVKSDIPVENCYMGVADEPNDANFESYKNLCELIKRYYPEVKLFDAILTKRVCNCLDAFAVYPINYNKEPEFYDNYRKDKEVMFYVAASPRKEKMINRFIDFPLITTRYLHYANYRYDFKGYLHWAVNFYQKDQDPFMDTCCKHYTHGDVWMLPPGDTHIIYPGKGKPYSSIRLENERMSEEEYEMLSFIAKKDKALANRLCSNVFRKFDDFEFDYIKFEENRKRILKTLESIKKKENKEV